MAKLIFENIDQEYDINDGDNIIEACEKAGVPFACGYEGICGSCIIEITEGMENLTPPTQEEQDFLGEDCESKRLACQCKIKSGIVKAKF